MTTTVAITKLKKKIKNSCKSQNYHWVNKNDSANILFHPASEFWRTDAGYEDTTNSAEYFASFTRQWILQLFR